MIISWDEDEMAFRIEVNCDFTCFELRPCHDPFCACLTGSLVFFKSMNDESEIGFPVHVDLESKSCMAPLLEEDEEYEESVEYKYIKNFIANKFDDSDWSFLTTEFIEYKQEYVEDFDVIEPYLYQPPYEIFEQEHPEKRIKYRDVFPHYKQFEVVFDDTLYQVDEFYCCKKNCECDLVKLKLTSKKGLGLNCEYDFVKDQITSTDFDFAKKFIDMLKGMTVSLEQTFRFRELQLKCIGADIELSINEGILALAAEKGLLENIQPIVNGQKIGRNEPCPCGSGKKYKKCCLVMS